MREWFTRVRCLVGFHSWRHRDELVGRSVITTSKCRLCGLAVISDMTEISRNPW